MALLGILKEKDNVFVINESMPISGRASQVCVNNLQSWVPNGLNHTIIAGDCKLSAMQVVKNIPNFISPREEKLGLTKQYLIKSVLPRLINEFYNKELLDSRPFKELSASFIIASKDKAYFLGNKGTIREVGDMEFFHSASQFMQSALEELKDLPILERIKIAAIRQDELYYPVRFPILVRETKDLSIHSFTRQECQKAYDEYISKESD